MIIISHVVALSNNNVIGKDNDLPWNLKTDLKHFKDYTSNKIIVMGRKTFESIGKPLPNRINYIVSNTIGEIAGAKVFNSTEGAIEEAKHECSRSGQNEIVRIGGGTCNSLLSHDSIISSGLHQRNSSNSLLPGGNEGSTPESPRAT